MQLDLILAGLEDISTAEQSPTMEGRTMAMTLGPKPQVMQRLAAQRAVRERDGSKKEADASQASSDDELDDKAQEDDEGAEETADRVDSG